MSLQALMPPCAQTECDRLTGTIEKRSTVTPSSASLIVAASPANPPPTTITRFFAAAIFELSVGFLLRNKWSAVRTLLSQCLALLGDELQVMIQVRDGVA